MVDKHDVLERLAVLGGLVGRIMVFVGMTCGCILLWVLIIRLIKGN
jgi:hypothetical protein